MPARQPARSLRLAATTGLFMIVVSATAQPPRPAAPPADGIKRTNEENFKLYKKFSDDLLALAQKWEKSDNPDEKTRAKSLRAALKIGEERGVENLFRGVLGTVSGVKSGPEFDALFAKDAALLRALEEILETLETEDEADRIKREIAELKEFIKEAQRLKREQENLLARTGLPKTDPTKLANDQKNLSKDTQNLANKLGKNDPKSSDPKSGQPMAGEPKDGTTEPKPNGKAGDNASEPKSDTAGKQSDTKTPGDPKMGGGDPKGAGEPKTGGDPKKAGDDRGEPKMGDPKGMGDPKMGDPKGGPPMAGMPMDGRPPMAGGEPKEPGQSKSQGQGKGDSKQSPKGGGDAKPMDPSGKSPPMGGMPPPSPGGAKPPSGGMSPPSPPRPPNPNNPNDEARRNVEEAVPPQQDAEKNLQKNDRPEAQKKEDEAIRALERALAELEKRLQQLREKEMLKKLEDLERRVTRMLRMQVEVYEATKTIDGTVTKNMGKATTADIQKAGVQAEKEGEIATEAAKALRLLEGEGTAVVFAGVLGECKKDMEAIQKQLNAAKTGAETQLVEEQVIEQLQRMLDALKKAQQDLKNPPPPPPPGMPPPPNDKKNLVQLIEQLKLLRDLQRQVNDRTTAFGRRVTGEQATDPFIQEQLRLLGDRQRVLQDMLNRIAAQLNQ
jgi:hypothetical protein